jgi:hypothetical protein
MEPFKCKCGRTIRARDDQAGKVGVCPSCGARFSIPDLVPIVAALELGDFAAVSDAGVPLGDHDTKRSFFLHPVVLICTVVTLCVVGWFGFHLLTESNSKIAIRVVKQSKKKADDLLSRRDPYRAYFEYGRALQTVDSQPVRNDRIMELRREIVSKRDELYPLIKERLEQEQAERDRLAEQKNRLAEQKKAAEEKEAMDRAYAAEEERLSKIKCNVTGGAFIVRKDGRSDVLRGLTIRVIKAMVPRSEARPTLLVLKNNADIAHADAEARLASASDNMKPFAEMMEARTKGVALVVQNHLGGGDKELVDVKQVYEDCRFMSAILTKSSSKMKLIGDETNWPEFVRNHMVKEANSGIDGLYGFKGLMGGRYYFYALYQTELSLIEWLVPIEISEDGELKKDFFNDTATLILNKEKD